MDDDGKKKLIVFIIVGLFCASLIGFVVLLIVVRVPPVGILIYAAVDIALMAALFYYGKERIDEINEGVDNDTDNY